MGGWAGQLINGLAVGAVYALIALGYTLVFGVLRLFNFAHCDVMMAGAYIGWLCAERLGLTLLPAAAVSAGACALLGLAMERFGYRPLYGASGMPLMVVALGISLLLQYTAMLVFGAGARVYPLGYTGGVVRLGSVALPVSKATALLLCVSLTVGLELVLKHTRAGRAVRAVADDKTAARLCGIYENRAVSLAFVLGSALAGISGVVYGSMYLVSPLMGLTPGLKAFAASVIGGIGSIPGAVLGGLALGLSEALAGAVFGTATKDMVSFVLLIAFLLLRPGGIMNSRSGTGRV